VADLKNDQLRSGRSSLGDLDPLGQADRLEPLAFAAISSIFHCVAIALACSPMAAGQRADRARTTSPDQQQFNAMLVNLMRCGQSVDRIANNIVTNQEQMTRSVKPTRGKPGMDDARNRRLADGRTIRP